MAPRDLITTLMLAMLLTSGCKPRRSAGATAVDTVAARQSVEIFLAQHYAAFARGDVDYWTQVMADSVYLSTAEPASPVVGKSQVHARMAAEFGPALAVGVHIAITPAAHAIWISDDGRTAASTYELNYVSTYQNKSYPVHLRSSILMIRDSARWEILATHYSRPISQDTLFMALVNHQIPEAGRMEPAVSSTALDDQFRHDLADISKAPLADNVVLIMPAGGIVAGREAARNTLVEWLGRPGNAREAGTGLRAVLTPSGTAGWVAANLDVPIYAGPESGTAPVRVLMIYRQSQGKWEIIQGHFSVGLRSRR
ncbi:MAG: nuclear transport factor 2 family protein [Gemmatimonadota bacterium]